MSDKDFFFDDEDAKPTKKDGSAKKPAAATGAKSAVVPSTSGEVGFMEQSVTVGVTSLLAVITLLVGVIVGFLLAGAMAPATGALSTTLPTSTTSGNAPSLSDQQLNQPLPAGHPSLSGSTTSTTGK